MDGLEESHDFNRGSLVGGGTGGYSCLGGIINITQSCHRCGNWCLQGLYFWSLSSFLSHMGAGSGRSGDRMGADCRILASMRRVGGGES